MNDIERDADEAIVNFYAQFMEEEDEPKAVFMPVADGRAIIRHRNALAAAVATAFDALELADAALCGANMNMKVVERKVRDAIATLKGAAQ